MTSHDRDLLYRALDADLLPEEEQRLHLLLGRSAEARAELAHLRAVRTLVAESAAEGYAYGFTDRVMRAVALDRTAPTPWWSRLLPAGRPAPALAGALVVLALCAALGWWTVPRTISVAPTETRSVALPDGTTVELSSGSRLSYRPFTGRSMRRVVLEGEAFFDVRPSDRPFVVRTFNARVQVVGTRFNVQAWPGGTEPETFVTLEEGAVDVRALAGDEAVRLAPSETTVIRGETASPAPPEIVPLNRILSWRNGGLLFRDRPLDAVAAALERRFGVEIDLADPALARYRVQYLNQEPGTVRDVLTDVLAPHDLRFRATANGFEIVGKDGTLGEE